MGEWSPEATGGSWLRGGTGKVGDWFEGTNATPERSWARECEVAKAEQGRDFTFVVGGVESNLTWWSYEIEKLDDGRCNLTERWWVVNLSPALQQATPEQLDKRFAYTEVMLQDTIAAIKKVAEQ